MAGLPTLWCSNHIRASVGPQHRQHLLESLQPLPYQQGLPSWPSLGDAAGAVGGTPNGSFHTGCGLQARTPCAHSGRIDGLWSMHELSPARKVRLQVPSAPWGCQSKPSSHEAPEAQPFDTCERPNQTQERQVLPQSAPKRAGSMALAEQTFRPPFCLIWPVFCSLRPKPQAVPPFYCLCSCAVSIITGEPRPAPPPPARAHPPTHPLLFTLCSAQ